MKKKNYAQYKNAKCAIKWIKSRRIKGYENMRKDRLLSPLNESGSVETEKNFDDARIKKIKKDFNELRDRFKQKIKEIKRNIYK